jgi:hypothetical protein
MLQLTISLAVGWEHVEINQQVGKGKIKGPTKALELLTAAVGQSAPEKGLSSLTADVKCGT